MGRSMAIYKSCGPRRRGTAFCLEDKPEERLKMYFIHNCIAHPLLFFSCGARWAIRFHDWTAPTETTASAKAGSDE